MSEFLNARLQTLEAYTPGEQPQDKQYIKLNTNESPFPPSKGVIAAINKEEIDSLRLYCDPECKKLKSALSALYGVRPENVFLSNGSDDILNFAFMAYGKNGAAYADITYGFYSVFAALHGVESEIVPLKEDFTLDVDGFCNKKKLIVIANPNAPTGRDISLADIERILQTNKEAVVLIDEAYVDFGGTSCVPLTKKYKNLLCVGTFSKSRCLAGARLGFAIADEGLVKDLQTIQYATNPYNVNRLTQVAGLHAVLENDYYADNCRRIMENRKYTETELTALGFDVLPSKANFLFAKSDKVSGKLLYEKLKEKGVLIRHFEKPAIKEYNRITIGSMEEMKIFIAKVKEIIGEQL